MTDQHQRWPAAPGCDQGVDMKIGHAGLFRFDWERDDSSGVSYLYDVVTALYSGGEVGLHILDIAPVGDAVWWWPSDTPPPATDLSIVFEWLPDTGEVRAEGLYVPTGRRVHAFAPDRPAAGIYVLGMMAALDAIGLLRPKVEVAS